MGLIYLPSRRIHHAVPAGERAWRDWGESSEAGIANASGPKIFTVFAEDGAGADLTGQGADLSGANLVLSDNGNVGASAGTPPYKDLDGNDDFFQGVAAQAQVFCDGGNDWCVVVKAGNLQDEAADIFYATHDDYGATYPTMRFSLKADGTLHAEIYDASGSPNFSQDFTDKPGSATDPIWLVMQGSPGKNSWAGFATSRPTKKSDFDSGKIIETSGETDMTQTWLNNNVFIGTYSASGYDKLQMRFYYLLFADCHLIQE